MLKILKNTLHGLLFFPKMIFRTEKDNNSVFSNFFVFLLLVFVGFYYGSLYFFNPFDTSWMTVVSPQKSHILNPFGEKGALLSSFSIYYLGLGSWVFPLPLLVLIIFIVAERFSLSFFLKFLTSQICFLTPCLFLLSYHREVFYLEQVDFLAGGAFGVYLGEFFLKNIGPYGSHLFSFMSLWFSIALLFDLNFISPKIPSFFVWSWKKITSILKSCLRFISQQMKRKEKLKSTPPAPPAPKSEVKLKPLRNLLSPKYKKSPGEKVHQGNLKAVFKKSYPNLEEEHPDDAKTEKLILKTLEEFGLKGTMLDFVRGPSLITYHFRPEEGVRQARVFSLADDLALALKVQCVMIKPATEKRALGIQVPRAHPELVSLGDILNSEAYEGNPSPLTLTLGLSEKGEPVCEDLASMPHLLIAGSTGSGKSVCLNTFICSILTKASPEEVRFLMIDPKMLELSVYNNIPHLLAPVVTTDLEKAKSCLNWAVYEMERRYSLMEKKGVRDIASFNERMKENKKDVSPNPLEEDDSPLPYIVVIIDELADLMLMAAKDIEGLIQRLTQKARACGIHLILATQRPSVDVVTGIIKANLPCRLSFRVVSRYDSKTILDQNDAEKLLGRGDMLFMKPGAHSLQRIQGAFVSEEEVNQFVSQLGKPEPLYDENVVEWIEQNTLSESSSGFDPSALGSGQDLYEKAIKIARSEGKISTSFLQRHLSIGYNRAANLIERMEKEGLISGLDGSKKRKWLPPS